jgi:type IV secretion system protein VirD4
MPSPKEYRDKFREVLKDDFQRLDAGMAADVESAVDALDKRAAFHGEKFRRAGNDARNDLRKDLKKKTVEQAPPPRALPQATSKIKLDLFGVCALMVLAALALGAAYEALQYGLFHSAWELAGWLGVLAACIIAGYSTNQGGQQMKIAESQYATREDIDRYGIETDPAKPDIDQGIYLGTFDDPDGKWSTAELRYKGGLHLLCFGPPGSGKSMSLVVPNLAHLKRSLIVIDPKGELAAITAKKRAALGKVIVLNPFGLLAGDLPHLKSEGWNPLLQLHHDGADFEGDARTIADALIEKTDNRSRFFDASAENLVTALVMWERFTKGDKASLLNIRAILSEPNELKAALKSMSACKIAAIRDAGARAYARLTDTNSQSTSAQDVIDTALSNLGFLSNELVAFDMARGGAIDFGALHGNITTVYLILPLKDLTKQAKWLRLFVNLALAKLYETSPIGRATLPRVMLILDEFGNLGRLSQIIMAMTTARGLRIQLWMFLQNLAQLKTHYKDEWTNFFTGCGASTTFKTGAWDTETAQHLAKAFGDKQMMVASESRTGGSAKPEALPLIRAENIARLPPNTTISVIEPCPWPVEARSPIYERTRFKDGLDPNPYYHA